MWAKLAFGITDKIVVTDRRYAATPYIGCSKPCHFLFTFVADIGSGKDAGLARPSRPGCVPAEVTEVLHIQLGRIPHKATRRRDGTKSLSTLASALRW
jgi:hypothetical protein